MLRPSTRRGGRNLSIHDLEILLYVLCIVVATKTRLLKHCLDQINEGNLLVPRMVQLTLVQNEFDAGIVVGSGGFVVDDIIVTFGAVGLWKQDW